MTKRARRQRDVLTVEWVCDFERIVCSETAPLPDRVFAGFVLAMTFLRARHFDITFAMQEPELDLGKGACFVEVETSKMKMSNLPGRRKIRLNLVGPGYGLTGLAWGAAWLQARAEAGLSVSNSQPIMPAIDDCGRWLDHPISSGESTIWMRELLITAGRRGDSLQNVGTHSCKATVLS
eukprot:10483795-Karenia_brevis.AAC.1